MKSRNLLLSFLLPIFMMACQNQPDYAEDEDNIEEEYRNGTGEEAQSENNSDVNARGENQRDRNNGDQGENNEQNFVREAASSGMMEVRLAEMAMDKSTNSQVRDLARVIRNDHEKANQQLQQIAGNNNWKLPDNMLEKHKNIVDRLSEIAPTAFDQEYLQEMVDSHQKAIARFEQKSDAKNNMQNQTQTNSEVATDLNSWITQTLPVLKKHLENTRQLQRQI